MLTELDPDARKLADYMSELSEEAHFAGWLQGLEFELWDAIVGGPRDYGGLQITREHIRRLQELSALAGGWIVIDDVHEETLLPLVEWKERFEMWKQMQKPR